MIDREQQVYDFIRSYRNKHGFAPSYREIGAACGISSTSNVRYWIDALVRRGLLKQRRGVARGLVVR